MSETDPSGTSTPAPAPAAVPARTEPVAPAAPAAPASGAFGATPGSGLARGKRPAAASASAPTATIAGYKPTALEVITPTSVFKNPFTGETTVSAPPANEPAVPAAPAPAAATIATTPIEKADPSASGQAKAEINILPPEAPKRPVVGWEAPKPAAPGTDQPRREERRDDGDSFRSDRRNDRRDDRRDVGQLDQREPREPRRYEQRDQKPWQPTAEKPEEKKSGGIVGWFKGLFGKKKPAETPAEGERRDDRREGGRDDDRGGHRRHRGGRGRGRYRGGPRDDSSRAESGQPHEGGGEHRGEGGGYGGGGGGRRRRRSGRGRFRGDGDRGGRDPRLEGQQGGGAI